MPAPRLTGTLLRLASGLDLVNVWIGRSIAWLALVMVLVTFLVVVLRYGFDVGSIALQESVTYMHGTLFMLGAAYTLQQNGHVRVDIFYQRLSPRGRAWIDLIGTLALLLPVAVFMLVSSWDYVVTAWGLKEGSREAGGLPYVYLLKTLMVIAPLLLLLQGLVWVLRNGLFLSGVEAAGPPAAQPPAPTQATVATGQAAQQEASARADG
jgi:TRAP-type mannitol/chloroaromatic compound transport system permease small subunit